VTGDFTPSGLTDDVSGLAPSQVASIAQWRQFYLERYKLAGVLQGRYYDSGGEATPELRAVEQVLEVAAEEEKRRKAEEKQYPACNSRWSQAEGGEVRAGGHRFFFSIVSPYLLGVSIQSIWDLSVVQSSRFSPRFCFPYSFALFAEPTSRILFL
jgi:hypothetical protein